MLFILSSKYDEMFALQRILLSPIYIHPFSCPSVCPTNDTIEDPRDLTTGWNSGVKFYKFNFEKENFKSEPKFNFSKNEQETRMISKTCKLFPRANL